MHSEIGAGAGSIAEIVEEIRERLPHSKPAPALEPEAARFRLFDAVMSLLRNIGRRQPVVLILDDLHWADQASLRLLEFVAGELKGVRLLLVGTYRDAEISRKHPLSRTLAELTRHGSILRMTLHGLSQEDVTRFIDTLLNGAAPPPGLVEAVYGQTEGNPLFVTEVVRLLVQEGRLRHAGTSQETSWSVRIPDGVREVIGRRLDRLSERCNQVLTIASVVGRQFTLSQLGQLIDDLPGDRLLEVLEEAITARVIEEVSGTVEQFQFTHALIGETLAGELSTTRRVRLHAQIGSALEALYGEDAAAYAAELAHHFAQAATVVGSEKLARYSALAGERAMAMHAYEEALGYFERALAAKESQPADAHTAAILFGLGRAQLATLERHRFVEAAATFRQAFETYVALGDAAGAVRVAERSFPHFPGVEDQMGEVIERALKLAEPESKEAGHLLSRYGRVLGITQRDYRGAQAAFARSIAIAEKTGDVDLELRALANSMYVDFFHIEDRVAIEKGARIADLARRATDSEAEVIARYWFASCLRNVGEISRFGEAAAALLAPAERLRNRFWQAGALWFQETLCVFRGDWESARAFSDRGLMFTPTDIRLLTTRVVLEYESGNVAQGNAYRSRLLELMRVAPRGSRPEHALGAASIAMAASITLEHDHVDVAQAEAQTNLALQSSTPILNLSARLALAMIGFERRETALAAALYDDLRARSGILVVPTCVAADRVLGRVAQTLRRLDDAIAHYSDAVDYCLRIGHRPEQAWSAYDYAGALHERDATNDRTQARLLLDDALVNATELGMRPLRERVERLRARVGAQ